MKTLIFAVVTMLFLSGCMSVEQKQKRFDDYATSLEYMKTIEPQRVYVCKNRPSCDKAFRLAKVYVQENSDMRVQHSDDTMISTYAPNRKHQINLKATMVPDKGESSIISISGECKDDPYQYLDPYCPSYLAQRYEGFRKFIESRID